MTTADVVVPCDDLDATLAFFTKRLGFRIEVIFPAEHPQVAVVSGHGVRLRLDTRTSGSPVTLRLASTDPAALADGESFLTAPGGTRIEIVAAEPPLVLPPLAQSLAVTRAGDGARWGVGRAGMRYRDLIPDRQGGRFIASHIQIPEGGPVPDYVHFHHVRFQMIFCRRGWVRVAYEDQGDPIVMHAGDCVLQPPHIRHRVLESSPGLEVVEIGCPAEHETRVDHDLALPTPFVRPDRDFGGQRFVFHQASGAPWTPWLGGFERQDTGIGTATDGLAGVYVIRVNGEPGATGPHRVGNEFHFLFVLEGAVTIVLDGVPEHLDGADSVVVPESVTVAFADPSPDLRLLQVTLPADPAFVPVGE